MSLSGIDVRVLVHELSKEIVGSWITNIYQLPNKILIFKLRKSEVGTHFLLIEPGKRVHLTQFNRTMPSTPSNYCKSLRSHLRERRINSIVQREMDRIVVLNIGPEEGMELVVELFGRGNVILVSPSRKILSAIVYRRMKDRDIHPGRDYIHMPSQSRDLIRNGYENLSDVINSHPKIVNVLNVWLGLGPIYSRYVLKQSKITTKKTDQITEEDIIEIQNQSKLLFERLIEEIYDPVVYLDESEDELKIEDLEDEDVPEINDLSYEEQWDDLPFSPENVVKILPWKQLENDEGLSTYTSKSMGTLLDVYYSSQESQETFDEEAVELESTADKYIKLLNQQEAHQVQFFKDADKNRVYGDLMYHNFQYGSELIKTVYDARKNNMEWDVIREKLELGKEKNIASALLFEDLFPKEAVIVLKLSNDETSESVKVDFRKPYTDIANEFYQSSKKSKKKAQGAETAIQMTKEKIKKAKLLKEETVKTSGSKAILLKRRKRWYEKFHWTETEEDYLVIAGIDAASNERIVKRYVEPDDIFIHADVQGAPSTVIKSNNKNIPNNSIEYAAKLAVTYSSAWKAKRIIADAFYVYPDQISLTPPSGEFLPKGSVMIYGQKNFVKDVSLEIYIGLIIERSWARLIASFSLIKVKNLVKWVRVVPGDLQRGSASKQIFSRFLKDLDPMDVQKVKALDLSEVTSLLPGNCKIIEWQD
ncbi:MAG: hypothetical protein HeimC2_01110 [Candidatus Heimdallarchaeota archaeon LC_2]|nr:MAG: hypothetical protein HeimC2_01110 [Candidatus Heimdallarchaeota archaeon LC_2]